MTVGIQSWERFVADGVRDAASMDELLPGLDPKTIRSAPTREVLATLALRCFRMATGGLLLGAEDVGRLALACETCLDLVSRGVLAPEHSLPTLASGAHTLRQAFDLLADPDKSGARTDGVPVEAARRQIETLFPVEGDAMARGGAAVPTIAVASDVSAPDAAKPSTTGPSAAEPDAPSTVDGTVWVPTVDDDMVELFFEEASERIDELSTKLIEIEHRPGDEELLRAIFRDLHTVKGSSAMVALTPMNRLAHAAEDLVGQLRDGARTVDEPVVNALLGALDGLREVLDQARARQPIVFAFDAIVERLKNPAASVASVAAVPEPAREQDEQRARPTRTLRQTIRVDFDKLDRLLNLVGELVLGRDGLHSAIQALSSVSSELSSDRQLTRRLMGARRVATAVGGNHDEARAALRASLSQLTDEIGRVERVLVDISQELDHATGRLDSVSDELRDQVMKLRMVPVGGVFRKHHRTVRDLSHTLGKRARLELSGEDTELDKLLVEALDEPLMHLVRNAVDHGVESPEARSAAGKPGEGVIKLSASHRGNQMVIQISDDGGGIDPEALRARARDRALLTPEELETFDDQQILDVIFRPGFSTAQNVSEVSGRGVGMDVVRQAIVTRLKGVIDIESAPGEGTTFTLRLPLTLAIIQVLLARAGGELFAIPLDTVVRTLSCPMSHLSRVQDREVLAVGKRHVPLIRIDRVLELEQAPYADEHRLHVVLAELSGELYALACEHVIGKKEIVIKSLGDILEQVPCAAGATLIGDRCAIILDVPAIVGRAIRQPAIAAPVPGAVTGEAATTAEESPHVLLVEDSDIVRESLKRLVLAAGYRCTTAVDGVEGLELAKAQRFDLVSTDVMMPRMDGYELTRALRATQAYKNVPIVMVTSRGERIDRVRGFDAGVDEYITKPHDRQQLVRVVRRLLAGHSGGGDA